MPRQPNKYTRVTTILDFINSSWKQYWIKSVGIAETDRISRESTEFGRQVHAIAENYLTGKIIEKTPTEREQFCGDLLIRWCKEAQVKPLELEGQKAVEVELKSETYGLIGHPDLICTFDKDSTLFVCDWKTSKEFRLEYPLQLAAYAMMLKEQYGLVCNDGAIIRTPSDPNVMPQFETHEYHQLSEKYQGVFLECLDIYNYFSKKGRFKQK